MEAVTTGSATSGGGDRRYDQRSKGIVGGATTKDSATVN